MATYREDVRQEVRDNLAEASGIDGAIWSDALLNRHISREIVSLPKKNIYLEQSWTQTLSSSTDYSTGLVLPSTTVKVESVERNDGTSTFPEWNEYKGCDFYSGALFFPNRITETTDIRVKIKSSFTTPSADGVALDVPDATCEVVAWGVTLRCYRILIGHLRGSVSWDAVTKPGDLSIPAIQGWIRDAEKYYKELIQQYSFSPKPRDINLVS